jgi:poly(ADP-ribose) glycohydrolase ARH3
MILQTRYSFAASCLLSAASWIMSDAHLPRGKNMTKPELETKYLGGMVGSAIGDAMGELAFQYSEKNRLIETVERMAELRYTDDTAMAIGLATSLLRKGHVEAWDLGETFRRNFEKEPWRGYATGPPTIFSLVHSEEIDYVDAAQMLFGGAGSFGNGAAMRIVPLGLFFHNSPQIYQLAIGSAEVTHAHPIGKDGAAVQAFAVAQAVKLDPTEEFRPEQFVRHLIGYARTREMEEKLEVVKRLLCEGLVPSLAARQLGQSVAVHESLPFGIYSFLRFPSSFEDCLYCAIMHGGDRDTLGAMAGALSGAYLGFEAIPLSWRTKLENREKIEKLALELAHRTRSEKG